MIKAERFKGLEEKIGYSFTNKRLLALAMTHSSYANEQRGRRKANNERLEFLGDAVLEVTISDYVFREYPSYNEGEIPFDNYLRIDNSDMEPDKAARLIQETFNL